jgi:hypothetical protein
MNRRETPPGFMIAFVLLRRMPPVTAALLKI